MYEIMHEITNEITNELTIDGVLYFELIPYTSGQLRTRLAGAL